MAKSLLAAACFVNIVEQRAMHDLACTCGTCNLEPIEDCQCEFAARMRGEIQNHLRGVDISTAEKHESAYADVRRAFAAKYGPTVLTPHPEVKTDRRMGWLPVVVFGGGAFLLVLVTRRSIKRRRAS